MRPTLAMLAGLTLATPTHANQPGIDNPRASSFTHHSATRDEAVDALDGPPLPLGKLASRMTLTINIAGVNRQFLVDTGAERSSVSHSIAAAVGGPRRAAVVQGVFGTRAVETVDLPPVQIGSRLVDLGAAPILRRADMGADGMLGTDGMRGQRVKFDFANRRMSVVPARDRLDIVERDAIVVRATSRDGRLILTQVTLGGVPVVAIVDTGSETSLGNGALLQALQRRGKIKRLDGGTGSTDPRHLMVSATGDSRAVLVGIIPRLEFNELNYDRVQLAFDEAPIFAHLGFGDRPAILLGMDLIGLFDQLSIDFAKRTLRFTVPRRDLDTRLCTGFTSSRCNG